MVNPHSAPQTQGAPLFLQFATTYTHGSGQRRLRVCTVARSWADSASSPAVAAGFDQEAAVVLMARLTTFKAEHEEGFDALRWLDRSLIRVCSKFGEYVKDDPGSFRLPPEFAFYPQFVFHLRRSQFLQVFNNSPDETAFFRSALYREAVANAMVMIQPPLVAYSFEGPPAPVELDVASITPNRILLCDQFFFVCVLYGSDIAAWRREARGYAGAPSLSSIRCVQAGVPSHLFASRRC